MSRKLAKLDWDVRSRKCLFDSFVILVTRPIFYKYPIFYRFPFESIDGVMHLRFRVCARFAMESCEVEVERGEEELEAV